MTTKQPILHTQLPRTEVKPEELVNILECKGIMLDDIIRIYNNDGTWSVILAPSLFTRTEILWEDEENE